MDFKWVHSSAYSSIPANAVVGGNDKDGDMIYVGRSYHMGDMLVAKILPTKQIAFISWRGQELPKIHFEVLCGQNLVWQHCYDHIVPENAVLCGETSLGQNVYIGRGYYEGSLTVGKISSVHRALFIPFCGLERRLETYEILVNDANIKLPSWSVPTSPPLPPPPIGFGEVENKDIKPSLAIVELQNSIAYPPPPPPSSPPISIEPPPPYPIAVGTPVLPIKLSMTPISPYPPPSNFGQQIAPVPVPKVPVLPLPSHCALPPKYNYTPAEYITPAETLLSPPTSSYIPATTYNAPTSTSTVYDTWIPGNLSYIPPNAVYAGYDADRSQIFVSRAYHNGCLIPGKAVQQRSCAYISLHGQEIPKYDFEILIGDYERYEWIPSCYGNIPSGAVEGGRSESGELLYVGRAYYCGTLTPGKIHCSHQCLYIPFGGTELRITDYEVLVRRFGY